VGEAWSKRLASDEKLDIQSGLSIYLICYLPSPASAFDGSILLSIFAPVPTTLLLLPTPKTKPLPSSPSPESSLFAQNLNKHIDRFKKKI